MNAHPNNRYRNRAARQRGLTLVEIMVAMAIALFLLGGLFTIVQNTKKTFVAQNNMAQLQDSERLAMTLITDVIQAASYYPNPTVNLPTVLPAGGLWANAGQGLFGTTGGAAPGDTIYVRFMTANNDQIINCTGGSNATGANKIYTSEFLVDANGNLACRLNGAAPQPLVGGPNGVPGPGSIVSLKILYGVKTDFTVNNGAVDSYLDSTQMSNANWANVIAVQVVLTFNNPLYLQTPNQPQFIRFQRVVDVMAQTGVRT
jgi:type IV pilus assembly protein PilW